jgi:hypothetical protein
MRSYFTAAGVALAFRIEFMLNRADLINALCWSVRNNTYNDPLPTLTRIQATRRIQITLRYAGQENYGYWADGHGDAYVTQLESWAAEVVDRHFGDLLTAAEEK